MTKLHTSFLSLSEIEETNKGGRIVPSKKLSDSPSLFSLKNNGTIAINSPFSSIPNEKSLQSKPFPEMHSNRKSIYFSS